MNSGGPPLLASSRDQPCRASGCKVIRFSGGGLHGRAVKAHFDAGQTLTFASLPAPAGNIVPNHAYAAVNYDEAAQTVTLFNPWGADNVYPPGLGGNLGDDFAGGHAGVRGLLRHT